MNITEFEELWGKENVKDNKHNDDMLDASNYFVEKTTMSNSKIFLPASLTIDIPKSKPTFTANQIMNGKVIYSNPCTILLIDKKNKFISRAYNEPFNKEKGLLMCICKAIGINHTRLNKLIENAKCDKVDDIIEIQKLGDNQKKIIDVKKED